MVEQESKPWRTIKRWATHAGWLIALWMALTTSWSVVSGFTTWIGAKVILPAVRTEIRREVANQVPSISGAVADSLRSLFVARGEVDAILDSLLFARVDQIARQQRRETRNRTALDRLRFRVYSHQDSLLQQMLRNQKRR